jgi:hypothetical protein
MNSKKYFMLLKYAEGIKKLFDEELHTSKNPNVFSKRAGINKAYISRYINGKQNIPLSTMIEILTAIYNKEKDD